MARFTFTPSRCRHVPQVHVYFHPGGVGTGGVGMKLVRHAEVVELLIQIVGISWILGFHLFGSAFCADLMVFVRKILCEVGIYKSY